MIYLRVLIVTLFSGIPFAGYAANALQNADVGNVATEGGASFQEENLVVLGSGHGIVQTGDAFHCVWQANQGDYAVSAKIHPGANTEGALVVRETEDPVSPGVWVGFNSTVGKIVVLSRAVKNGSVVRSEFDAGGSEPIWLRLTRTGNTFASAFSEDGTAWEAFHQVTIVLPERSIGGFAVAGTVATATFEGIAFVESSEETSEQVQESGGGPSGVSIPSQPSGTTATATSQATTGASSSTESEATTSAAPTSEAPASLRRKLYVNKLLGNDTYDGLVSLKSGICGPKKTIQAALALAEDGDEIVIASGTYSLSEISPSDEIIITPVGEVVITP